MSLAFEPFTLPCGQVLPNRVVKAATEENLGNSELGLAPSEDLIRLYRRWGKGGAGLIISGHVMINLRAIAGPCPTTLDGSRLDSEQRESFKRWINSAKEGGSKFWLQLNHPGRQAHASAGQPILGPSDIAVQGGPALKGTVGKPKAMTSEQIIDVVQHFTTSAKCAEELGADGVEIHAAHGYLLSSFLSPLANVRSDEWGGSLEGRAKLLFDVVDSIRKTVSTSFALGVKINSADFQRGGFDEHEAEWVITQLNHRGVDLVEISGGSYEVPVMQGAKARNERTLAREAYFLEFAERIAKVATMPLMVTGGIYTKATLERVVASGRTVAGMASSMCLDPDLPSKLKAGLDPQPRLKYYHSSWPLSSSNILSSAARNRQLLYSMRALSKGKEPIIDSWPLYSLLFDLVIAVPRIRRYRRYMSRMDKENKKEKKKTIKE